MNKNIMRLVSVALLPLMLSVSMYVVSYAETEKNSVTIGEGGSILSTETARQQPEILYGLGGKALSDSSFAYNFTGKKIPNIYHHNMLVTDAATDTQTWEFSMYVSGDAIGSIRNGDSTELLRINSDGSVLYWSDRSSGMVTSSNISVNPGEWFRVAVSYNNTRQRWGYYVNDIELEDATTGLGLWQSKTGTGSKRIGFSYQQNSGGVGVVAYDDAVVYKELYVPGGLSKPTISVDDTILTLNGNEIKWNAGTITTVAELYNSIYPGDNTLRIFKNVSMKDELTAGDVDIALNGSEYIAVESPSGIFSYYTVKEAKLEVVRVDFIESDGLVGAEAVLSNPTSNPQNVIMLMVFFNEHNVMKKVVASDDVLIDGENISVSIDPVEAQGLRGEIMFIDGWATQLRVFDEIYSDN